MKTSRKRAELIKEAEYELGIDKSEKWWTRGVYLLAIVFFGMFVASAIKTFVF